MSRIRSIVSSGVSFLPTGPEGATRRLIDSVRRMQAKLGRIDHRPISPRGRGPVVLLDARGLDVDAARAAVEQLHSEAASRIILVTDDVGVHLYRGADASVVEFLPDNDPADSSRRLAELVRQYRVERTCVASQLNESSPPND